MRVVLALAVAVGASSAGRALAGPENEIHGARSEAMGGAHRGLGDSNDTLTLNPAGLALTKRYSIDGNYSYSGQDDLHHFSLSILDSKTGAIAGGIGYTVSFGDQAHANVNLHRIYLVTAYPILENLAFGITGRTIRGDYKDADGKRQNVESYSTDLGLSLALFDFLGIGVVGHNVVTSSRKRLNPPHLGIGLAYKGEALSVATDLEIDLRPRWLGEVSVKAGLEYFLGGMFPLRFGYRAVPFTRKYSGHRDYDHVLGGGLGWVTDTGSVEVSFTQSVVIKKNWDLFAALKFYL